jgi:S-DNA-T family DNA segregation ATPase FtsK/SpoIIIE
MAVTKIELLPSKKLMVKVQKTKNNIKKQLAINKELSDLANHWKEIMAQTDSFNKSFHTYTLAHITIEDYGYHCRIYAPWGMALEGLEKLKPVIETGLKCIFKYEIPDHKDFAMVDIIKPEQVKCNDIPFTPVKVKPYELFAGVDIKGKPILFDINNTPHILLGGATRKGKNGSLNHMLISLIYSCNENEVELYLLQCAKSDLVMYEDCKQVKCCIFGDLEKMNEVLDYIISEIQRRSDLLKPMIKRLEGDNILHYNNLHPKNKLSYIYIVVDEIMVLMLESATKEIKEMKDSILSKLQQVAEFGGATGITYISCHQKPESKLMPTF